MAFIVFCLFLCFMAVLQITRQTFSQFTRYLLQMPERSRVAYAKKELDRCTQDFHKDSSIVNWDHLKRAEFQYEQAVFVKDVAG